MNAITKLFFLISLLTITYNANAEITTKKQADQFLSQYCIALVNGIEKTVEKQKQQAKKRKWDEFSKSGRWISGLADIYSKLCK